MFSRNKKYVFKRRVENVYQMGDNSEVMSISGDTMWNLNCSVDKGPNGRIFILCLLTKLKKEAKITAKIKISFLSGDKFVKTATVVFKLKKTKWTVSRRLRKCINRDHSVTFICEVEVMQPNWYSNFQGEPLPACSLIEDFEAMLSWGNFADVIVECRDKELMAHRAVLAARSPVFAAMFSCNTLEPQYTRIVIPDIGSEGISALLKYIYTGGIPSKVSELTETLVAANRYQLPHLKTACEWELMTKLTVQNVIPVFLIAEKHQFISIKQYLLGYIKSNIQEIIETDGWADLVRNCTEAAAELSSVGYADEMEAFVGEPVPPYCLINDFLKMLSSGNLSDVRIECSGKELKAHRAVLAVRSPVFDAMFWHDTLESQTGRIVVTDIGPDGMAALLEYIYAGRIPSEPSKLVETLAAANKYDLPRLKIACQQELMTKITVQSAIPVLVTAEKNHLTCTKQFLLDFIKANIQDVFETEGWIDLVRNYQPAAEYSPVKSTVDDIDSDEGRRRQLEVDAPSGSTPCNAKRRCLRSNST